ncbi:sporulation initiation factor Spo0A C-terminal domain-containing protein [Paenibacillus sp. RC67]|uniref:sporulation initiation factor Spo0A C-terminal domain-containing protein n=1 Tax=Paenibacillus sp. RC67 TaxID=3039392 RepID=UPI0024AE203C|nr:sporulation initiation factor Spo0A C-terminal domain-containing protein [Paenibacillus sp. RC67]
MSGQFEEALLKELKMLTNKMYELEANQRNMMKLLAEMNNKWSQVGQLSQPSHSSESPKLNAMVSEIQGLKSALGKLDNKLMVRLNKLDEIGKPVVLNVSVDSQKAIVESSPKPIVGSPRASFEMAHSEEREKVVRLLNFLGVPIHVKGFQYLKEAILIVMRDPEAISAITRSVYPVIAEEYRTTPSRVERGIRHAIEVCWVRKDKDSLKEAFGNSSMLNKSKPTNLEFITMAAHWCQLETATY